MGPWFDSVSSLPVERPWITPRGSTTEKDQSVIYVEPYSALSAQRGKTMISISRMFNWRAYSAIKMRPDRCSSVKRKKEKAN